jgi:hypothetical protein
MDLSQNILLGNNLYHKDGIWFAKDRSAISYPEEANSVYFDVEDKSFWFQHRNNCITHLAGAFDFPKQFFDVGGGNGFVSSGMQKAGYDTYLLEPGIHGCLNGKRRNIRNIICSTLQESGLAPGTMPSCGLFDVVEHIEKDVDFLKQVHLYMKDDGPLLLTVPAFNLLWSEEDDYIGHYRRYSLKTIAQTLSAAGFKVEYSTYLFSFLVMPILLFRSLPTWLKIKTKRGDPKTVSGDHEKRGLSKKILHSLMNWELSRVRKRKKIFTGSSCLVVARKIQA